MTTGTKIWLAGGAAVFLLGVAVAIHDQINKRRALEAAQTAEPQGTPAADETSEDADEGTLIVWVPAGLTGDDFWVYLSGHLVSAPPHGTTMRGFSLNKTSDNGWEIEDYFSDPPSVLFSQNGYFVDSENYRSYIHANLNVASGDSKGLFYPVHIPIQAGRYTVELAYFSKNQYQSSFPFAISPKYHANVEAGTSTELHIGVPDNWVDRVIPSAATPSPSCAQKPDVSYLTREMNAYLEDPVVQALSIHKEYSNADGVVTLDLPIAEGGSREYDSVQVRDLADATLDHYYNIDHGPSQSYIDDCKNSNPEWSSSFDEYAMILGRVRDELQFLHRLAGK